jgi:hypothetical protein
MICQYSASGWRFPARNSEKKIAEAVVAAGHVHREPGQEIQ